MKHVNNCLLILIQKTRLVGVLIATIMAFLSPLITAAEFDLTDATIVEINSAIDAGELSSEKIVELYLARIEAYDQQGPKLNAVLTLNPNALERARELDRERENSGRRSPMHGIPVVIKDNMDTADMPTTAGSFMLKGFNSS